MFVFTSFVTSQLSWTDKQCATPAHLSFSIPVVPVGNTYHRKKSTDGKTRFSKLYQAYNFLHIMDEYACDRYSSHELQAMHTFM